MGLTFGQAVALEMLRRDLDRPGIYPNERSVLDEAIDTAVAIDCAYPERLGFYRAEMNRQADEKQGE